MSDTTLDQLQRTGASPTISQNLLKSVADPAPDQSELPIAEPPIERYLVKARRGVGQVTFRLSTSRLVERREIELANEAIRTHH